MPRDREKVNARERAAYAEGKRRYYQKRSPEQNRKKQLRRYGLTADMYIAMLAEQNGVCASCGTLPESKYALSVDHNHQTGAVRGLLCISCNTLAGFLEHKNRTVVEAYLRRTMMPGQSGPGGRSFGQPG